MTNNKRKAEESLTRLSEADKSAVLLELVQNSCQDATDLILKKTKLLDETPLTETLLKSFGSRAYAAIHQLDRLRPSQQFEMMHQIDSSLSELVEEARRYSPLTRLGCLARVAGVFSHASKDAPGEVFKGLRSCGGLQCELRDEMHDALTGIRDIDGETRHVMNSVKSQLERVHGRLCGYCIQEFQEIIEEINSKMGTNDDDDDSDDE